MVPYLAKAVGNSKKDDVFIGHSVGCQTILRYFETLSDNEKVDKVILVAPWVKLANLADEEIPIANPWEKTPINWERVKLYANSFTVILSDNDSVVPLDENKKLFEEKLDAKIIIEHDKNHFSHDGGVTELPLLLTLL